MNQKVRFISKAKGLFLVLVLLSAPIVAAEVSYDRYAAVYEQEPQSQTQRTMLHLFAYPFQLVRWPIDRTIYFTEKHSLDKKARWAYETLQNEGFTFGLRNLGGSVDIDALRVLRLKDDLPDAKLDGWIEYEDDVEFAVGAEIGAERLFDTGLRTSFDFQYETRPREHFFGVGSASSPGDGSVYSRETTNVGFNLGYSPDPTFGIDSFIEYRNVNISSGKDGGRGQRGEARVFPTSLNGFNGDSFLNMGLEAVHDSRNQKENSTSGGQRRVAVSYHEGLNSSEARFMRYEVDVNQYFRLGSDRRVLAVRLYGQHNDEINGGHVPFHQMAKLGGFGRNSRLSETLRAFEYNRFTDESALLLNLEYRYTIWEYREFKADAIAFFEEGQVFDEFKNLQIIDFRESYGMGLRFSLANIVLLSVEMAHGDEGTNLYFKTYAPF